MKIFKLLIIAISFCTFTAAQVVYHPVSSNVYGLLDRLALKKIIEYSSEVKPLSRMEIASYLQKASTKLSELNSVEKEELEFYKLEFSGELKLSEERWHLLKYSDSLFSIRVSPLAGYGITSTSGKGGHIKWPGVYFYGTYSNWFGASFSYVDRGEFGDNVDNYKYTSPVTGAFFKTAKNGIESSDVRGSISFNWKWGSISLLKEYNQWGSGNFGQVFISSKAPSYTQIKLELKPADWFRVYYFHGWLNSQLIDSSLSFYSHTESSEPFYLEEYRTKFIAANYFIFTPWSWLNISAGNSYVYTGSLRPEAFIPFMYYKALDHNAGREGYGDGNGQIFFNADVKYPVKYNFYTSLLIDVLEIGPLLKGNGYTSWFAYTLGFKKIDLIFDNLDINVEYTKTNPWVYENRIEATDYKHLKYYLGHWIGQNADLLDIKFDYQFLRGLKFNLTFELFRKGGMNDIITAYKNRVNLPFLYGNKKIDKTIRFEASYEYMHDLFLKAFYQYSDVKDDEPGRTKEFMLGRKNSFQILLSYGLQ